MTPEYHSFIGGRNGTANAATSAWPATRRQNRNMEKPEYGRVQRSVACSLTYHQAIASWSPVAHRPRHKKKKSRPRGCPLSRFAIRSAQGISEPHDVAP